MKSLLRKAISKPIDVVIFRGLQELNLGWLHWARGWQRIAVRADSLLYPAPSLTLMRGFVHGVSEAQATALSNWSERVVHSEFEVFEIPVPPLETCDFSQDWRFGHRWGNQYFKKYSFYEQKVIPYDVKIPWELSRAAFLVPVLANMVVAGPDADRLAWVSRLLARWDKQNPLAYSVNWYPMEASMRAVILVQLLDLSKMIRQLEQASKIRDQLDELQSLVVRLLFKNAMFVWHTREYTDVRGNHFTANLVALYLAGIALSGVAGECRRWRAYARPKIAEEIRLQVLSDGVNFEKACGYHKLVLELFALAAIAAEREQNPFSEECLVLLEKAAVFSDAITRPDGLAANFGDNDDACALPLAMAPTRSHGPIIELLRAWRGKSLGQFRFPEDESLAAQLLVGRVESLPPATGGPEFCHFHDGGYHIVRDLRSGFFFVADMGEVGMGGRGGHGHNDFMSFELHIDGTPVIQDSGCSGYTSDLAKKAWFRSTEAHATVQLFGAEMADLITPWSISNHAKPHQVYVKQDGNCLTLSACHSGYARIREGSNVCRRFSVDPERQLLSIHDKITVYDDGGEAGWHFPVGATVVRLERAKTTTRAHIGRAVLHSKLSLEITEAPFSQGYAMEVRGSVLQASATLSSGTNHFNFNITKASKGTGV